MGQDQSTTDGALRPYSAEMYLPVGGMRMNAEKSKVPTQPQSITISRTTHKTHIVQTAFVGKWSMLNPVSDFGPASRTGHFSCYCEELELAIIGFGLGKNGEYYNDIWALRPGERVWRQLSMTGDSITPRSGAAATVIGKTLYIFGGFHDPEYYNDFYIIDLGNGIISATQTTGDAPSARLSPVIGNWEGKVYIWGGYDGGWPSELHFLDLNTFNWTSFQQDVNGRTNAAYAQVQNCIYVYGSAKAGGILIIDMAQNTVELHSTTGPEPPASVTDATLTYFDFMTANTKGYLMLIGGKGQSEYTLTFALDIQHYRWFVFHVMPDGSTVSAVDGNVSDLGLFMIPRTSSMGAIYFRKTREIVALLGHPLKDPSPLFILELHDALSILHLRTDMLECLNKKEEEQQQNPA